ncbi:MAG: hypothetical protein ACRELX_04250 [Longimicrobiales bacterium]
MNGARAERIEAVVAGVVRQAVADAGAAGVIVLDGDTPEGRLLLAWSVRCLGRERVWGVEPAAGWQEAEHRSDTHREELMRAAARVTARERNGLVLHPANKTALLLGNVFPPEPVLPFGDLYASACDRLAGGWTAPAAVRALVEQAGGIAAVDEALEALFERRIAVQRAVEHLPECARSIILQQLELGRFWRRRAGLVPKLGTRTLGIDLMG